MTKEEQKIKGAKKMLIFINCNLPVKIGIDWEKFLYFNSLK